MTTQAHAKEVHPATYDCDTGMTSVSPTYKREGGTPS